MRFDIITLFPQMFDGPFSQSIVKRAMEKSLIEIFFHDLRNYTKDKYRSVDDYPYGGDAGMVMMIEPIDDCIQDLKSRQDYDEIIYLTADGDLLDQPMANHLSTMQNVILLCGHYKGVDERVREHLITKEISIGNFVMSGGEMAAAVLVDTIVRLIPGVLGDECSALSDSFQDNLISPPVYTRPADYKGWKVPDILLSGNEKKIREWRIENALQRTKKKRPGLLKDQESGV
jgi:tRNA (guanine37-N1)-methyltransferase